MSDIRFYAYISTGKLSAMFTLWTGRECNDMAVNAILRDNYICNLAAVGGDEEAQRKALDYCERMSERRGVNIEFRGFYDEPQNGRKGKLSVRDTAALEQIEQRAVFPFGKHAGTLIADGPDSYVLYWADQMGKEGTGIVAEVLAARCMGVAMERDLIAERDAQRAERAELDAKSQYVGAVGERLVIEGEVIGAFFKDNGCGYADQPEGYWITKVRSGENLLTYMGNKLAERGERVRFRATVKAHNEYQGVKSTKVNRPAKVEILAAC